MALTSEQESQLLAHLDNESNPHAVTSSQVGLADTDDLAEGSTNKYSPYTTGTSTGTGAEQVLDSFADTSFDMARWVVTAKDGSGNGRMGILEAYWDAVTDAIEASPPDWPGALGSGLDLTLDADISGDTVRLKVTAPSGASIAWARWAV